MSSVRETLEIKVEVTYDDEFGTVYVATSDELGLVTDGQTFEELLDNLRKAVALYYEGDNLPTFPRLEVSFVVTDAYAQAAPSIGQTRDCDPPRVWV
jgi:predicted RNase H-like HicB family nuclease